MMETEQRVLTYANIVVVYDRKGTEEVKVNMPTELGATTERELRAQRRRRSNRTVTTPGRKKPRTDRRVVVETDDGGQLQRMTDDVRVASGNTLPSETPFQSTLHHYSSEFPMSFPVGVLLFAARTVGGVTADTGFEAGNAEGDGQSHHGEQEQADREETTEQQGESGDETVDLNENVDEGYTRGWQTSRGATATTTPRVLSPASQATAPPPAPFREVIRE
ncbi:unnamed protein product [Phytophthora fragariaefolia]|uniref:Unnamed protein product n=1 Tax=Phytophthora fragariaefolia TaxID=1490495 RepID=A0A9W6Y704_9STRA|nr:unnamed protein product [Phytophthora fragariaefolia]